MWGFPHLNVLLFTPVWPRCPPWLLHPAVAFGAKAVEKVESRSSGWNHLEIRLWLVGIFVKPTWRPHQADMGSWESEKREKEGSDSSNCLHVASTLLRSIKFQRCWGSFSSLKLCGDNLSANQQMLRSYIGAIRSCQVHVKLKTRQFELLSHFKKRHKDPESCPRFFLYENVGAFFCGISQIQIFTWSHFSLTSWVTTYNS